MNNIATATPIPFSPTEIVNLGAGVVALALVFYLVYCWSKSIAPQMKSMNELLATMNSDNKLHSEIIKNNTDAINSMSQSTANVAAALKILESAFDGYSGTIDDLRGKLNQHDIRSEQIHKDVIEIKAYIRGGGNNGNH